jgi:hypothetical protein
MYVCVSGDTVSELQVKLTQQTAELECFSKVIVCMAAMKFSLPANERLLLQSVLCPILQEGSEQVRLYVCMCMYVYVCKYVYICMYVFRYASMYVLIKVCSVCSVEVGVYL